MQNSAMYISVILPCVYIFFNFVVSVDETIITRLFKVHYIYFKRGISPEK